MALVKCPDCGRDVSSEAPACVGCGRPMRSELPPVAFTSPPAPPVVPPPVRPVQGVRPTESGRESRDRVATGDQSTAGVILLLAFVVIGVLVYYLSRSHTPTTAPPSPPRTTTAPTAKPEMKLWEKQVLAETMLQQSLREPKSFERIGWKQYTNELAGVKLPAPYEVWGLTYRARNGFGGVNVEEQIYIIGPNGVVPYTDKK